MRNIDDSEWLRAPGLEGVDFVNSGAERNAQFTVFAEQVPMESPDGETRVLEIGAQTVCYVPPYWIHRSINVGNEDLVMMFCYPADAGQDYGIIEQSQGMRHRVMADGAGKWRLIENLAYRAREAETVAALLQPAR